jgi:hypothetical protein
MNPFFKITTEFSIHHNYLQFNCFIYHIFETKSTFQENPEINHLQLTIINHKFKNMVTDYFVHYYGGGKLNKF